MKLQLNDFYSWLNLINCLISYPTIAHGGDIAGFNSVLLYVPHNKVKMVVLSNTENGILSKLRKIEKLATSVEI